MPGMLGALLWSMPEYPCGDCRPWTSFRCIPAAVRPGEVDWPSWWPAAYFREQGQNAVASLNSPEAPNRHVNPASAASAGFDAVTIQEATPAGMVDMADLQGQSSTDRQPRCSLLQCEHTLALFANRSRPSTELLCTPQVPPSTSRRQHECHPGHHAAAGDLASDMIHYNVPQYIHAGSARGWPRVGPIASGVTWRRSWGGGPKAPWS